VLAGFARILVQRHDDPGFLDPDGVVEGATDAHSQVHEGRNGPPADAHLDVVREPPGVHHITGGREGSTQGAARAWTAGTCSGPPRPMPTPRTTWAWVNAMASPLGSCCISNTATSGPAMAAYA